LPVLKAVLAILGNSIAHSPAEIGEMMPLLVALLGLGGYRTYEKLGGVAAK